MNKNTINYLQNKIDNIHTKRIILTLKEYNLLLKLAVKMYEMEAVVFLYDSIKENNLQPSSETYTYINKLHSKTIQNNSSIRIPIKNVNSLKPRRRIHKIMKGYNYTENYNKALFHKETVKKYLHLHPELIQFHRIKLAKKISKGCKISFNDARYIITHLKRIKFFTNIENMKSNKITDYNFSKNIQTDSVIKERNRKVISNDITSVKNKKGIRKPKLERIKKTFTSGKQYSHQKSINEYFKVN